MFDASHANSNDPTPRERPKRSKTVARSIPTLDYLAPGADNSGRTALRDQVFWGACAWGCALVLIILGLTLHSPALSSHDLRVYVIGGILTLLAVITLTVTFQYRWPGFIVGILLAILITCVIPVVILMLLS